MNVVFQSTKKNARNFTDVVFFSDKTKKLSNMIYGVSMEIYGISRIFQRTKTYCIRRLREPPAAAARRAAEGGVVTEDFLSIIRFLFP